jgi:hypothetical protein
MSGVSLSLKNLENARYIQCIYPASPDLCSAVGLKEENDAKTPPGGYRDEKERVEQRKVILY